MRMARRTACFARGEMARLGLLSQGSSELALPEGGGTRSREAQGSKALAYSSEKAVPRYA